MYWSTHTYLSTGIGFFIVLIFAQFICSAVFMFCINFHSPRHSESSSSLGFPRMSRLFIQSGKNSNNNNPIYAYAQSFSSLNQYISTLHVFDRKWYGVIDCAYMIRKSCFFLKNETIGLSIEYGLTTLFSVLFVLLCELFKLLK